MWKMHVGEEGGGRPRGKSDTYESETEGQWGVWDSPPPSKREQVLPLLMSYLFPLFKINKCQQLFLFTLSSVHINIKKLGHVLFHFCHSTDVTGLF